MLVYLINTMVAYRLRIRATLSNYKAAWNEIFDCSGVGTSSDIVLTLKVFQVSL